MELCVSDQVTKNATADDVTRAIDAEPHEEEWFINLESDTGAFLEAIARAEGTFDLSAIVNKRSYDSVSPVDTATLKAIFLKFFHHDTSWRAECPWKEEQVAPVAERDTSGPPTWALAIIIGTIVVVSLIFYLSQGSNNAFRSYLPFGNSDYFYIGLIFLPMVVLIAVAVAAKLIEARGAAAWPSTTGRIVKSGVEARHHQFSGEATTVTNAPAVEYEFSARGRTWRGNRIGVGEDSGGANMEATLKRYPVGATVTVYYDPDDPSHCVLERDIPKGMGKGCAIAAAVGAALVVGVWYLTTNASRLLDVYLPNGQGPATVFAACFGLVVLLFFFAYRRMSKAAAGWPSVRGKVVSSGTESFEKREDGRTTTSHVPAVEYSYSVHGIAYRSRQINLGVAIQGSQSYAEGVAARYREGSDVEVHYDPDNPSNAALENPTGYSWLLLAIALACFGVAVYASGVFK